MTIALKINPRTKEVEGHVFPPPLDDKGNLAEGYMLVEGVPEDYYGKRVDSTGKGFEAIPVTELKQFYNSYNMRRLIIALADDNLSGAIILKCKELVRDFPDDLEI